MDTIRFITSMNGQVLKFNQREYINKNKWDHSDPSKRRGAWIGNEHDSSGRVILYGLEGGYVLGWLQPFL
ncbi:hypothetical protein [Buttiauxella sp. S19-1]|uniref:hypothetical protein n=1 Tax=Buttiauxella sp. S19-1 TaxID=941430 RepID=UPI001EDBBC7F|nr:hypothetical protein [Buttiauxella sp. S19-1]